METHTQTETGEDFELARAEAINAIQSQKAKAAVETLMRPDAYDWSQLFPRVDGVGATSDIRRRVGASACWLRRSHGLSICCIRASASNS